ncbi:MAG: polyphosphate kinase 2 family protein [Armatimonadetes bacterium]|nr:polyphosphate kinase 2 family protein [Armatimonadota bacterium]
MSYCHLVKPGEKVKLKDIHAGHADSVTKEEAAARVLELGKHLDESVELMYAAGMNGLLVVLQGIDTSGKDGTIRCILGHVSGQACRVSAFKVPTTEEAAHDFLWRVHGQTPGRGGMTIFNRSHYEDVLVARVHKLVRKEIWKDRYDHINSFEQLLADSGILVMKFYLHITKEEQEQRLLDREKDPDKSWKLSVGDWKERELWPDYINAYEDALEKCSTKDAPWRIVPANTKWFRDLAIMEAVTDELKPYRKVWRESLVERGVREVAELKAYRAQMKTK